jgi:hypothetical protein
MLCLLSLAVIALFAWLISHQPAVLFSQTKSATSNQPAVLFSQNKSAPVIRHQPTEQVASDDDCGCTLAELMPSYLPLLHPLIPFVN